MSWPVLPHGFLGSQVTGDNDTYRIERSLRFNSADSAYLSRTPSSSGSRTTATLSFWVKRSKLGSYGSIIGGTTYNSVLYFDETPVLNGLSLIDNSTGTTYPLDLRTTQVFRDPSAWYHIVINWDSGNATSSDRARIYVNGSRITSFNTAVYPTQNYNFTILSNDAIRIGDRGFGSIPFDGYLTEIHFIDGQALTPSSFGETDAITGRWKAKAYTGDYGVNGFYLNFSDNSGTTATTLGKDSAPISGTHTAANNWTPNNFSVSSGVGNDSLTDSPTNYGTISTTLTNDTYQISRSLRFNSADSAYLSRTPASAGNRKTWTWSGWVKKAKNGAVQQLFNRTDLTNYTYVYFLNDDTIQFLDSQAGSAGSTSYLTTSAVFRDPSAWYHIVLALDTTQATNTNRVKLYVNGVQLTSYNSISWPNQDNQLQINTTNSHYIGSTTGNQQFLDGYLTEINFVDGQALTPDSFGVRDASTYLWKPKAYTGTYGTNGFYLNFSDNSGTTATTLGKDQAGSNNWTPFNFQVSGSPASGIDSLVDTPTYYGTDAGAGGEARGDYATLDPLASIGGSASISNGNLEFSRGATIYSGARANYPIPSTGKYYFEVTGVTASSMTIGFANELFTYGGTNRLAYDGSGVKINKAGTNSSYGASFSGTDIVGVAVNADAKEITFYKNGASQGLAFSGSDYTGFGQLYPYAQINDGTNTTAAFNFGQRPFAYTAPSGFRALRDYNKIPVPTGGVVRGNSATWNPLNKNATNYTYTTFANGNLDATATNNDAIAAGTINFPSSGKFYFEAVWTAAPSASTHYIATNNGTTSAQYRMNGQIYNGGSLVGTYATLAVNDVIGVAVDCGAGSVAFYKNGALQTTVTSTAAADSYIYAYLATTNSVLILNCGQRPWAYDAPFGFLPLCTTNLPTPTIKKPSSYMDVVTYTGNGATQTISGLGFSPDLVWIKARDKSGLYFTGNKIFDTTRGAYKALFSEDILADQDYTSSDASLTSFNSNGFTLKDISTGGWGVNESVRYVAWSWDEAPIAGMDIVAYTGDGTTSANRLIDHSLGVKPDFVITKKRSSGTTDYGWSCWHKDLGGNYGIWLNSTSARNVSMWTGYSNFSATKFTPPDLGYGNETSQTYVNYLWSEVAGFSKFGSYTGNGSADGPFVFTGMRSRFLMFKRTDSTGNWFIYDTARKTFNTMNEWLLANTSDAENSASTWEIDIISNGFKIRNNGTFSNASGGTYIFAAFAESPFKYARAR